jgi:N-acetylglucosaminyldiphosphoundecaprenol N-acetyl-beta-D-mannosaminyltransferase
MLHKVTLLGVGITNEHENKILEYIWHSLERKDTKYYIVTPNPEILVYAQNHPDYKKILNEAAIALPDGIGVFLGSALVGHPLRERIPGVDFLEAVCKESRNKAVSIGFLGAGPGVAKRTAECLLRKYPWIRVRFVGEEWDMSVLLEDGKNYEKSISNKKVRRIDDSSVRISSEDPIDILFVAYGFPKQEEWIARHLEKLPVRIAMGVGGAFDFISGEVPRAPFLIRAVGFEWLFRLVRQPWRLRRQLALVRFVLFLVAERAGLRHKI